MDIVWIIATFVPALMILVFVHELGHFVTARMFGMRVDKFSIGFPPDVAKKRFGQTDYVLGITPLGGYVKIAGMIDESLDSEFADKAPEPDEFRSKPLWQRVVVICAGVVFNMILAAVIFVTLRATGGEQIQAYTEDGSVFVADSSVADQIGIITGDRLRAIGTTPFEPSNPDQRMRTLLADDLTITVERDGEVLSLDGPEDIMTRIQEAPMGGLYGLGLYNWPSEIGTVDPTGPAARAGLQSGDRITAINSQTIEFWPQLTQFVRNSDGDTLHFTVERVDLVAPIQVSIAAEEGAGGYLMIGIGLPQSVREVTIGRALVAGVATTWDNTVSIITSLSRMVSGRESVRENLGGPVMVAQIIGQAARSGAEAFWHIVAVLSITLAIINILPIPVLDGGHLAFLIYEAIMRREPSVKFRMALQQIGMLLLFALMAFLIFNDIWRAVTT